MLDLTHPHAWFVVAAYAVAAFVLLAIGLTSLFAHRRAARLERNMTQADKSDAP